MRLLPEFGAWRVRIPLRLRIFFRGAFLLLIVATLSLALALLREEKQLSYANYQDGFRKTQAQIAARLRHPTGQLALLNPRAEGAAVAPLRPLLLPFSALDFDDRAKAQQAVEMAGCQVQYGDDANLCIAIGANPLAGGFIYAVGSLTLADELVAHVPGERDLTTAHRVQVEVAMRGHRYAWLAPYEMAADGRAGRGRLTGFAEDGQGGHASRPVRDFRGWLWQDPACAAPGADCRRRAFYALRLPIEPFREALDRRDLAWPPADLDRIEVRLRVRGPGLAAPLFDSAAAAARAPFALPELAPLLLPGETLQIRRDGRTVAELTGAEPAVVPGSAWLQRLIRALPVDGYDEALAARDQIATPLGAYELLLRGDVRSVNRSLAAIAARMFWFVAAMLAAIALTWAAIELRVIGRITRLTRGAARLSNEVRGGSTALQVAPLEELRGRDELGLLAGVLTELMQRVNEDLRREQLRVEHEKDQWHAVGHEIMSPLQSLMVLHASSDDPSRRYIERMQQAVRVLYGAASPSEAFEATALPSLQSLDADEFLRHVAANAGHAGIDAVRYLGPGEPVPVRGDEYALEDAVTHVLVNAQRHRVPGSPIEIRLAVDAQSAHIEIRNEGAPIAPERLERIFDYGDSDAPAAANGARRGQGLFVARTYLAKMGGTIAACNDGDGVVFRLSLQRAAA